MRTILTYGTYDLFHTGHYNILKRAKERGDYLIVGVTSDNYDKARGKLNVKQSLSERIENVKKTGLADKIIVEEYMGQKIEDIIKYNVDEFVLGSDWLGKFDYLNEYCKVTYLERTKGVSSTQLRKNKFGITYLGFVGSSRKANSIILESKYVSGLEFTTVYNDDIEKAKRVYEENQLLQYTNNYDEFLSKIDGIYISKIKNAVKYIKLALENKKHVMLERPLNISKDEMEELYEIAKKNNVLIFEGISTAYCPGFLRLVLMMKSGMIGKIKSIEINYSNIEKVENDVVDYMTYPLMAISKIVGNNYKDICFYNIKEKNRNKYSKVFLQYDNAIATAQVSSNMNIKDKMTIVGTSGYVIVEEPWWKTESFEIYTDEKNKKYCFEFDDDGLRYELSNFLNTITTEENYQKIFEEDSLFISEILEKYRNNYNTCILK